MLQILTVIQTMKTKIKMRPLSLMKMKIHFRRALTMTAMMKSKSKKRGLRYISPQNGLATPRARR